METVDFTKNESSDTESVLQIKKLLIFYLKKIHYFILSVAICLTFSYFKAKRIVPTYKASASILIKDDKNSAFFQETSAFQDLDYYSMYSPLDNEIAILKSRSLIGKVVMDLKLNVQVYTSKNEKEIEFFNDFPFSITFIKGDSSVYYLNGSLEIVKTSNKTFKLKDEKLNKELEGNFGSPIKTSFGEVIFIPKIGMEEKSYQIYFSSIDEKITEIANSIIIEKVNEYSNVILISYIDPNEFKATGIINNLIQQHRKDVIEDKNEVSKNSALFINERLKIIANELNDVEKNVQNYKSSNDIFDVITEKDVFLDAKTTNESDLLDIEMQIKMMEYLKIYIDQQNDATTLIPSNNGITDASISPTVELHNSLVLERNKILKSSSEKNPVAQNLESKIVSLKQNLKESIKRLEVNLTIKRKELRNQNSKFEVTLNSLPKKERELREIQRQQQIKESLYLYLLQKREETAITLALTVPNSKVIDNAYCEHATFSPSKKSVYTIGLMIGLILPILFFFIKSKLNTKIKTADQIEKFGLKIIAEIPTLTHKEKIPIFKREEKSSFSEAFRLLRTNLDFYLSVFKTKNKVVVITSTIPNEGKSFITLNLAQSLSLLNKKVVVLGMDLRSPMLHKYLDIQATTGISNFIINQKLNVSDLILKNPNGLGFDLINSGDIPPNPSEILQQDRMKELFHDLEKVYDYILVDTPPIGLVSDTLLLNKFSDLFLFVVRKDVLESKSLHFIKKVRDEEKLRNVQIVFNCSDESPSYQNKYAYYYGNEKKSWFQKIIHFFKS